MVSLIFTARLFRPKPYGIARRFRNLALAALLLAPLAAAAAPKDLVAFGDSLTAGYGLAPDEGFVPQLQRWLAGHGADVAVINAGVSGDTTAGGVARIDWTLSAPVDAMILTLGGNDLLRGLPPGEARTNLDAILTKTGEKGIPVLLVPMQAPGNYGQDYKDSFDAIYAELAGKHGAILADPFLAPILALPDRQKALADYVQPDGIHPNADGVALVVEALGPKVLELLARAK
jgi:acyl-CoA thioesterase-1